MVDQADKTQTRTFQFPNNGPKKKVYRNRKYLQKKEIFLDVKVFCLKQKKKIVLPQLIFSHQRFSINLLI